MPASVSIFRFLSSIQEILRRPGTRMIAAAPYALQPSAAAFAGSHASAILFPSGLTGMLDVSPFFGVNIRQRQSSVTTDTQLPVMSIGAEAFGVAGGPGGGAPRCADRDTPHI